MMFYRTKKIASMLIVFVMVFTYMGQTLEAVATTDGVSAITNGFFDNSKIEFKSYFEGESNENISNVNETSVLTFEISPTKVGEGFLKNGTILASSLDGSNINFKFSKIRNITVEENDDKEEQNTGEIENKVAEENAVDENNTVSEENVIEENTVEEESIEEQNTIENIITNTTDENSITENQVDSEEVESNETEDIENTETIQMPIMNATENEVTSRSSEPREEDVKIESAIQSDDNPEVVDETENSVDKNMNEEENLATQLIDEDVVIQEVLNENEEVNELEKYQVDIVSDNEIKVQTITAKTIIEVEIEYVQNETLNLSDLYKEINLNLSETYIDLNLKENEQDLNQKVIIGWEYTKDIEISSNYTKLSTYKTGEREGSILENKLSVKRETEDEKYLPIKNENIEIEVPTLNGEKPSSVSVVADKLMLSKGQDSGNVEFSKDNWTYENGMLNINLTNENNNSAINSLGTDEYTIVYKYAKFVEEGNYTFNHNEKVQIEEYSGNNNHYLDKSIAQSQEINAVIGDSISYSISTNEESINKAKINANYNSDMPMYETEFTTTLNLNILTSDLFEELRVDSSKESYLDSKETKFDATDIYYKKVKFQYNEIKDILSSGATIEIFNNNNELLYTLNSELMTSQESCEINLESKATGIYIVLKNATVNQNLSIEFTKAIQKSNYEKAIFNTFRKIESRVSATVKYANEDTVYNLSEIAVRKDLKSSATSANIVLNNNNLNTLSQNENVEMKIEFNNDSEDSDLYVNPSFELVFPKYVKNVDVKNVSLTYAGGLEISECQMYTQDEMIRMKINLTGMQTVFSESTLTHGTNIIISANITVDEFAPSQKDQIKMYYSNEGVTNYQSQTTWTISKEITPGILRETNGFDVAVINYQAPNGLVTANSIVNYDGKSSVVKSIKQGEKIAKIEMEASSRIATMQLFVSNNTGNMCNNIVLMGRVPFKNNKDVVSGQNMGTTVDTMMVSGIKEELEGIATIYYSENTDATRDLYKSENGWKTEVMDWSKIKSYMIVINGNVEAGATLKYSYDFEIPENLDYQTAIFGSFGAFYNNNSETATISETSSADKVGLKTEMGIPIDITITSNAEKEVGESRFVDYTVKVTSVSEETLNNIQLINPIPEGTTLYEERYDTYQGDNGYTPSDKTELQWTIDQLEQNESIEKTYRVKVNANMAGKKISNMARATMDDLTQKSDAYELAIKAHSLDIEISKSTDEEISVGDTVTYKVAVTNISGVTEQNVTLKYTNPKELQVDSISQEGVENPDYKIDAKTLENLYTIPEIKNGETKIIYITQIAQKATSQEILSKVEFVLEDGKVEESSEVNLSVSSIKLQVTQSVNVEGNEIEPGDEIEITLTIENVGKIDADKVKVYNELSEFIEPIDVSLYSNGFSTSGAQKTQTINEEIFSISVGETYSISITGKVKEDSVGEIITSKWKVSQEYITDIESDEMMIKIVEPQEKKNESAEENAEGMYSISGTTWIDSNNNGIKDEDDTYGIQAEIHLLKNGKMIKAINTNSEGAYTFEGLEEGEYTIVANYDEDKYMTTAYSLETTEENTNSKAYEMTKGVAVTDSIHITNSNVGNLDIGLVEKDSFDFQVTETIEKATVRVNGKSTEYDYDSLELAKLAMSPRDMKNANLQIEYKIRVDNIGNIDGKVSSIVDYIPNGMYFVESENPFWQLGTDGNIYYSGLKDTTIKAGDFQEVKLILQKKMTDDNSSILSNKTKIADTESDTRMVEAKANNFATQETIVTSNRGMKAPIIVAEISIIALIATFGYMVKAGYLKDKKLVKKVYR